MAETERLRSALLSSLSHDLRTPLAAIIGSASSLIAYGHSYSEEVRSDLVQTIFEEAERLNRFVGNLLDMTRLESGAIEPKRQWIDVDDLVGTALDRMRRRLAGHDVRTDIAPGLPLLNVDFVLVEQALTNLLDNAIKYSAEGTVITVSAGHGEKGVTIEVADQGVGIAEEDVPRIFDKFFRVRARDRKVAGTGLGLAICMGIVESHGGTIEAASDGLGRGSRFCIHLPVETPPSWLTDMDHSDDFEGSEQSERA